MGFLETLILPDRQPTGTPDPFAGNWDPEEEFLLLLKE